MESSEPRVDVDALRSLARLAADEIGLSEENVKQVFLVPLLEALGHERKHLDFERSIQGKRLNIFIKNLKPDCKVIIDTKRSGEDLNLHLTQMGMYAAIFGSLITVITNGVEVRFYSPLRAVPFKRSLLYSIRREELASDS